jgi:hypothetical protein
VLAGAVALTGRVPVLLERLTDRLLRLFIVARALLTVPRGLAEVGVLARPGLLAGAVLLVAWSELLSLRAGIVLPHGVLLT